MDRHVSICPVVSKDPEQFFRLSLNAFTGLNSLHQGALDAKNSCPDNDPGAGLALARFYPLKPWKHMGCMQYREHAFLTGKIPIPNRHFSASHQSLPNQCKTLLRMPGSAALSGTCKPEHPVFLHRRKQACRYPIPRN